MTVSGKCCTHGCVINGCIHTCPTRRTSDLKHWVGTAGSTTLSIGTSAGLGQVDTQLVSNADGTTGKNTVNIGTNYRSHTSIAITCAALARSYDSKNNVTNDRQPAVTYDASH